MLERSDQSELVERWRSQLLHQPTDVRNRLLRLAAGTGDERRDGVAGFSLDALESESNGGETRPQAVVQIATDATSLVFYGRSRCVGESGASVR